MKPAASAASAVWNQTSATVCSNHWPSGSWYFIELRLPLMVYASSGDEPSSFAATAPSGTSTAAEVCST